MFLGIVGSRSLTDLELVYKAVAKCPWSYQLNLFQDDITIVSGGARGVDSLAEKYALNCGYKKEIFEADWSNLDVPGCRIKTRPDGSKYNANAGFDRNSKLVEFLKSNAGYLIAILDTTQLNYGTSDTMKKAYKARIPVFEFRV